MAANNANTARISFDGKEYIYSYPSPSENDVSSLAQRKKTEAPWMSEAQARQAAQSELIQKNKTEAANRILKFIDAYAKQKIERQSDVGISQRYGDFLDFRQYAANLGLTEVGEPTKKVEATADDIVRDIPEPALDVEGARNFKRPTNIPDKAIREVPTKLVNKINAELKAQFRESQGIEANVQIKSPDTSETFDRQINNIALQASGFGDPDAQLAQELHYLDRFNKNFVMPSRELAGWTFITRPHLNLSSENLASARRFMPLVHAGQKSIPFAIRCWLDTTFAEYYKGRSGICPFVDFNNPFFVPLCNSLKSINNWPDVNVATETSEGGFFSENQTTVVGGDQLARGYDFSLNFREYPGGVISAIFDYWCQYMIMIGDGRLHQYMSDIEHNLMGYTVSIYRFITDHTGRNILRWAKATGCYPKISPIGTPFNRNAGEELVQSVNDISINFQVHKPDYNDPIILKEFNTLVDRYMGRWNDNSYELGPDIGNNHLGVPYITQRGGRTRLIWRYDVKSAHDNSLAIPNGASRSRSTNQQLADAIVPNSIRSQKSSSSTAKGTMIHIR